MWCHHLWLTLLYWTALPFKVARGEIRTSLEPPSGTTISAEVDSLNVTTVRCDIFRSHTRELTHWFLQDYLNQPGLTPINNMHEGPVFVHGEPRSSFPNTYQNLLIISRFVAELNGTVLECRSGDQNMEIGRFPLLAYSPPGFPENLTEANMGDTWVEMTWDRPLDKGIPPLSHYIITMTNGDGSKLAGTWVTSETSLRVTGILPSSAYDVLVTGLTELTGANKTSPNGSHITVITDQPHDVKLLEFSETIPQSCRQWKLSVTENETRLEEVITRTLSRIQNLCNCSYQRGYLLQPNLTCPSPYVKSAHFEAWVVGVAEITAEEIVRIFEGIYQEMILEVLQGNLSLIVGISVGGSLLVLLTVLVIVVVLCCRWRNRSRTNPAVYQVTASSNNYSSRSSMALANNREIPLAKFHDTSKEAESDSGDESVKSPDIHGGQIHQALASPESRARDDKILLSPTTPESSTDPAKSHIRSLQTSVSSPITPTPSIPAPAPSPQAAPPKRPTTLTPRNQTQDSTGATSTPPTSKNAPPTLPKRLKSKDGKDKPQKSENIIPAAFLKTGETKTDASSEANYALPTAGNHLTSKDEGYDYVAIQRSRTADFSSLKVARSAAELPHGHAHGTPGAKTRPPERHASARDVGSKVPKKFASKSRPAKTLGHAGSSLTPPQLPPPRAGRNTPGFPHSSKKSGREVTGSLAGSLAFSGSAEPVYAEPIIPKKSSTLQPVTQKTNTLLAVSSGNLSKATSLGSLFRQTQGSKVTDDPTEGYMHMAPVKPVLRKTTPTRGGAKVTEVNKTKNQQDEYEVMKSVHIRL